MKVNENIFYWFILGVLLFIEILLAIPLMSDLLVGDGSSFLFSNLPIIVGLVHIILFFLSYSNLVDNPMRFTHILGFIASIISLIPVIGFIGHIFVSVMVFKYLRKEIGDRNKRLREFKDNGSKIDLTYKFSDTYTTEVDERYKDKDID